MGADIHLKNAEGEYISYFRDAYNDGSLFSVLGLSWWADVFPLCDQGYLSIENAKKVKAMLLDNQVTMEKVLEKYRDLTMASHAAYCTAVWGRYAMEWKKLLDIIDQSIESNIPLVCSL